MFLPLFCNMHAKVKFRSITLGFTQVAPGIYLVALRYLKEEILQNCGIHDIVLGARKVT